MITNYHRPSTIEQADTLLQRDGIGTKPIAGGYYIHKNSDREDFEVVDVQSLGLSKLEIKGKEAHIDANVRLTEILKTGSMPDSLREAVKKEGNTNLRNQITLPGTIKSADGRSGLLTWLLGADVRIVFTNGRELSIGDFLPERTDSRGLIEKIILPIEIASSYQQIARTPADLPVLCMMFARWRSGRTRVSIGGFGVYPRLAFDANEDNGLVEAVRNACYDSADEWGSAGYRVSTAETLVKRCLQEVQA